MSIAYLIKISVEEEDGKERAVIEDFPIVSMDSTEAEQKWLFEFRSYLRNLFEGKPASKEEQDDSNLRDAL